MALAEFTESIAVSQDTYIRTGVAQADTNYNTDGFIRLGVTKVTKRILVSVPLPIGAQHIVSATLKLKLLSNSSTSDRAISIFRLLPSRSGWLDDQATWNSYLTGQLWNFAGANSSSDVHVDVINSTIITSGPFLGVVSFDISNIARAAFIDNESVLHALLIVAGLGATGGDWDFYDSENAAAANRPYVSFVTMKHPGTKPARKSLGLSKIRGNYVDGNTESTILAAGRSTDDFAANTDNLPGGDNFQTKLQPRP